jgi:hypothetical protein
LSKAWGECGNAESEGGEEGSGFENPHGDRVNKDRLFCKLLKFKKEKELSKVFTGDRRVNVII